MYAQKSLASGYRVTTDHHGTDVLIGEAVTAWADTTYATVATVNFTWILEGTVMRTVNVTSKTEWNASGVPGVDDDTRVYRFTDSYVPDEIGDWAVKAIFYNSFGQTMASDNDSFPVRATSMNVIPEVPWGTIAIILTMFGALVFFAIRKEKIHFPR